MREVFPRERIRPMERMCFIAEADFRKKVLSLNMERLFSMEKAGSVARVHSMEGIRAMEEVEWRGPSA